MSRGKFITFEGGEGVGKTTQIKRLEVRLKEQGNDIVVTREPGGTPAAEEIRTLLSHAEHGEGLTPEAEAMLLFAARSMHIKDVIAPALKAGKIVLCDRYIDSTRAYQGYLQSMDMDFILELERRIVGDYIPDITLLLDLSAEKAMKRVHDRGVVDHYDRADIETYETLRQAFLDIVKNNPNRCVTIDASQDEEIIATEILGVIEEKLK